jgi:hypothetical protein
MPPTAFSPTEFLHRLRDAETLNSFACARDPDRRQSDQAAPYFGGHRGWRFASKDDGQRAIAGDQMTKKQLERRRERVATQMRGAVVHGGDPELLDLLRFESDRLFAMIGR